MPASKNRAASLEEVVTGSLAGVVSSALHGIARALNARATRNADRNGIRDSFIGFFRSIAMQQIALLHGKFSVNLENLDLTVDRVDVDDPDGSGIVVHHREDDVIGTNDLDVGLMSFSQALD